MWSGDFDDFSGETRKKRRKIEKTLSQPQSVTSFQPATVEDLVTHSKKIAEVRDWLEWARKSPAILLLTGPTGSAKTATLKIVAKTLGIEVQEWINPVDKIEFLEKEWKETDSFYDSSLYSEPKQTDKFENFAFRSSRYQGLFTSAERRIILVEDFPNHFVWKPSTFTEFLYRFKNDGKCPIVFICTDDDKINLHNSLFPINVKTYLQIAHIKFNSVSPTGLMKILKRYTDSIPKATLSELAKASNGDIRTALSNVEFYLTGRKKSSKSVCKDVTMEFYQTLGRVLYPKRREETSESGALFLYDVKEIAQSYGETFLAMLQENFLNTFTSLKDVVAGCSVLSDCDLFSAYDDLQPYAALTSVIGLMASNKAPKRGGFQPMSRSRWSGVLKSSGETTRPYPHLQMTRKTLNLDVIPYLKHFPDYAGQLAQSDADRLMSAAGVSQTAAVFKAPPPPTSILKDNEVVEEEMKIEEFEDGW